MTIATLLSRRRRAYGAGFGALLPSALLMGICAALPSLARAQEQAPVPAEGAGGLIGVPQNWQIWHQPAATPIMEELIDFHGLLVTIITAITLLVFALLAYVIVRFNHKRNPTPSSTSHNTLIEVAWTVLPVLILLVIAIPSFRILFFMERIPETDMTLKVTGRQWYWDYEYPDNGGVQFSSYMVADEEITEDQHRILDVDTPVVLPVGATVRLLITAGDVIHSWGVPSVGVTQDAIPGRTNEIWIRVDRPGVYYGQCRELCGTGHAFMPIVVRAVPQAEFDAWMQTRQAAASGAPARQVAARPAAGGEEAR
jgi:cytochrome c oxidase subunit II